MKFFTLSVEAQAPMVEPELTEVGELHSLTDWQVSEASEEAELDEFCSVKQHRNAGKGYTSHQKEKKIQTNKQKKTKSTYTKTHTGEREGWEKQRVRVLKTIRNRSKPLLTFRKSTTKQGNCLVRELATLLENEGSEGSTSAPHRNPSASILLAVSEQEAEGTDGPSMRCTKTTDSYRKADHRYFKAIKFRFKTQSSKCHLHSQVLGYSDLQQHLWTAHLSSNIMEQRKKRYLPELEASKGCMHVPLRGVCIHPKHGLKPFCPAVTTKVHVLCCGHKRWHVLASHLLWAVETENTRDLDGEGRKMQDTERPANSSTT